MGVIVALELRPPAATARRRGSAPAIATAMKARGEHIPRAGSRLESRSRGGLRGHGPVRSGARTFLSAWAVHRHEQRTGMSALVRLRGRWARAVQVRSRAVKHRAVSNRNCVVATRGGEQRNEHDQSVTQVADVAAAVNSIRSVRMGSPRERMPPPATGDSARLSHGASLRASGEACRSGRKSAGSRAIPGRRAEGWRQNGRPVQCSNQGDPSGSSGVHGPVVRRAARRESERP